jgi:nucleotidyltransferase/DNA polymerase involved in DNA repair
MPSTVAMRKCAELVLIPPRFDVYRGVSQQIQAIFKDYTPLVEPLSLDEAYLDVTDNLRHSDRAGDGQGHRAGRRVETRRGWQGVGSGRARARERQPPPIDRISQIEKEFSFFGTERHFLLP